MKTYARFVSLAAMYAAPL